MYNDFALNSYFFRFVYGGEEWKKGINQYKPKFKNLEKYPVNTSDEIISALSTTFSKLNLNKSALLLSGGIDSAILASYLYKGMNVYSIKFEAENAIDETFAASVYAKKNKLNFKIIKISFKDYLSVIDKLIKNKSSPLHPIEPALYIASLKIKSDGFDRIIAGCNADGKFGGLDKILGKDWRINEFIKRYSFINPREVLKNYIDMKFVFKKFLKNRFIDTTAFLNDIFGHDTYLAFSNSVETAKCQLIAPYAGLKLKKKLDLNRIRNGESKYLLRGF